MHFALQDGHGLWGWGSMLWFEYDMFPRAHVLGAWLPVDELLESDWILRL
jgi:hypothetical protein